MQEIRRAAPTIIAFCIAEGFQVSNYQNIWLAYGLWSLAILLGLQWAVDYSKAKQTPQDGVDRFKQTADKFYPKESWFKKWWKQRTISNESSPVIDQKLDQKPPTLHDYFKSDFPNCMKVSNQLSVSSPDGSSQLDIPWHVCLDSNAGTKFVVFYIPHSPQTYNACVILSDAPN